VSRKAFILKLAVVEKRGPVGWVVVRNVEKLMEQGWKVDEYTRVLLPMRSSV
jgi:hypothetical protein